VASWRSNALWRPGPADPSRLSLNLGANLSLTQVGLVEGERQVDGGPGRDGATEQAGPEAPRASGFPATQRVAPDARARLRGGVAVAGDQWHAAPRLAVVPLGRLPVYWAWMGIPGGEPDGT